MKARLIIAAVAGAVAYFLLGWLIYGILLMGFYESHTVHYEGLMKEMPSMGYLFLSNFLMTFLMAWIFDKWANIRTFGKGFVAGLIISFLILASFDFSFLSMYNLFDFGMALVDIIVGTVLGALIAGFIAWILGIKGKENKVPVQE
jgi:hypothetical protein